jgi:hypothetical protein
MPKYIDTHAMGSVDPSDLKELQKAPVDQFGVTHHDILFNKAENRIYCVLNAPNAEAVRKHHAHFGITCDWVHEVDSTRP